MKDWLIKFDSLHGLYMVPLGLVGLWVIVFQFQYTYHVLCALIFLYAIVEGIRKFIHNPAKYAAKIHALSQKYKHLFEDKDAPQ